METILQDEAWREERAYQVSVELSQELCEPDEIYQIDPKDSGKSISGSICVENWDGRERADELQRSARKREELAMVLILLWLEVNASVQVYPRTSSFHLVPLALVRSFSWWGDSYWI